MTPPPQGKNLVILGMHRSGTSMVAGALARGGLYAGTADELMPAGADNPQGFWERKDVVALNDELLQSAGLNWFQPACIEASASPQVSSLLASLDGQQPWLLKDPRMLVTWPFWREALAETARLFVYRSPMAVASSLAQRHGFPLDYGLLLWEFYNRQALSILQEDGGALISYEAIAAAPGSSWQELQRRLAAQGVQLSAEELASQYQQQLNHSPPAENDSYRLSAAQLQLHELCQTACEQGEIPVGLPASSAQLEPRIREFSDAFSGLAEVAVLNAEVVSLAAERDRAREDFADSQQRLVQRTREAEETAEKLSGTSRELSDTSRELSESRAKADDLFHRLDTVYLKLLAFRRSLVGRAGGFISRLYKLLTLRPRSNTALEDVLDDAVEHVSAYDSAPLPASNSRLGLGLSVLSYLLRHPVASLRSLSWPRLKRALSVFVGSNREDLDVWVQQRFPQIDDFAVAEVQPDLDDSLDSLSLVFPSSVRPRVSIVIPVYNEYRMTLYCLRSLLEQTIDVEYEVIIADDASTDLTNTLADRVAGVQVVRAEANQGFVRNCGDGASVARGEYILFLNNDTAFTEGWLSQLVAVLDGDSRVGIVGPMLLYGNGRLQEAGGIVWDDGSGWNFGRMDDPASPEYNYRRETDYVSGACLLIRSDLWQELGGFDQRYVPAYYEDTDLCFSARAAGYQVIYQPTSRIYHFEGVSHGTDLTGGVKKHQVVNQTKFLAKWESTLRTEQLPNAQQVFFARDRSRGRRTVLVIDHYVPSFDKDAGSRSTWQYLQLMVELGYNVKFIGANFFPHQPYTRALQAIGIEVLTGEKMARGYAAWLRDHASCIDAVYVHRPHVAEQFVRVLGEMKPRPRLIYFGHDLHFLRVQRESAVTGDEKLQALSDDWKRRELAVFDSFDKIYYPSQVEVDVIAEVAPAADACAIPLYVLDDGEEAAYSWADSRNILFVAGFNHPPNVDGLCWFVDEVMPLLLKSCPQLTLQVVGSSVPVAVAALASEQVIIHGYLTDEKLTELYRHSRMVAVPLRFGAGVKGKVLEALQHGLPLVTTAIGAEGLPAAESVLNIEDSAAGFAQALVELEQGDETRLAKLDHYRAYLHRHFSKQRATDILRRDFGEPEIQREVGS